MLVVGEKEVAENNVSVRSRDKGEIGSIKLDEFIASISKEIESRESVIQN